MSKSVLLKTVNYLLFVSFAIQAVAGLILFFSPDSSETTAQIHKYNGVALTLLVLVHIALNWGWVKSALSKKPR
jgi:hypothetical protein